MGGEEENQPGEAVPRHKLKAGGLLHADPPGRLQGLQSLRLPGDLPRKPDPPSAAGQQGLEIALPENALHASAHQPGVEHYGEEKHRLLPLPMDVVQGPGGDKAALSRLQRPALPLHGDGQEALPHQDGLQFIVPVPGNHVHRLRTVAVAGGGKQRRPVLHQLPAPGVGGGTAEARFHTSLHSDGFVREIWLVLSTALGFLMVLS